MADYHKRAGKLGGSKSSRMGIKNLITKSKNILHGENAMTRVNEVPYGAKPLELNDSDWTNGGYIVGHSETGHNHVLERTDNKTERPDIELYTKDGITYIVVKDNTELVHKKSYESHKTLPVEKGIWRITRKNEYDPLEGILREVRD